MSIAIREACEEDAAAIAGTYNQGIADRGATFETAPRSACDNAAKLAERERYRLLVITDVKWCWGGRPEHVSSAPVLSFSIYLDRRARGRGLGRQLLTAVVDLARARVLEAGLADLSIERRQSCALPVVRIR